MVESNPREGYMTDSLDGLVSRPARVDIDDCEWVRCRGMLSATANPDPDAIVSGAIRCLDCDARYDLIWGVPFLAAYEREDIAGLIEIAANARADNHYPDRPTIKRLERLLCAYHDAPDRRAFVESAGRVRVEILQPLDPPLGSSVTFESSPHPRETLRFGSPDGTNHRASWLTEDVERWNCPRIQAVSHQLTRSSTMAGRGS